MQHGPKAPLRYQVLSWAHRSPNLSCMAPSTLSLPFAAARNHDPDCSRLFLEHSRVSLNWKYYLVQPPPFWDWKRRYFVSSSHPLKHTGGRFSLTLPTHSVLLLECTNTSSESYAHPQSDKEWKPFGLKTLFSFGNFFPLLFPWIPTATFVTTSFAFFFFFENR